ncbi:MAG: tRNA lysidine(34) synthetase TilS [Saprospiraceae bacterium]|nr:tRNA lysidine(34) synthetase TilS [Saprospiraceae bacterium]
MTDKDSLFERCLAFIEMHELCTSQDALLLAVSGGVDSMVLNELLYRGGYNIAIAHCNFQMRDQDSREDELFVRSYADANNIPFHTITFDTRRFAKEEKIGVQEAARTLRYRWFSQVMEANNYRYLVVAHHQDDQIETVMMNIGRGAGIYGLQGMMPKRHHIIRPLLFATKSEIRNYAAEHQINSREDSSNALNKYRRNYLRNVLIPAIETRLPTFRKRMSENIAIWQKSARLLQGFLSQQITANKKISGDTIFLEVENIEHSLRDLVVYEWLKPFGFNYGQVLQMIESLEKGNSGKFFFSHKNRIIIDRKNLILASLQKPASSKITIESIDQKIFLPNGFVEMALRSLGAQVEFPVQSTVALLDAQKINFPLTLRRWQKGDHFHPLGLQGKSQKVKKYFNNRKMSALEKENQWILTSSGEICWLLGERIDHRYRITEASKYALKITWSPDAAC